MPTTQQLKPLEKIDAINGALDKLSDAQGRAKCGYVWAIANLMEELRSDVLIMEEQIKDIQNGTEIEVMPDEQCETGRPAD